MQERNLASNALTMHEDKSMMKAILLDVAPVVQWIEHRSPEPEIWVRLPAGAPLKWFDYSNCISMVNSSRPEGGT